MGPSVRVATAAVEYIGKLCNDGDVPDPHASLGGDLLSVVARLNRLANARADLGMPYAQARLLVQIEELGESRISELAAADHTAQPTMTAQVRRLETAGWVSRRHDPSDARAVLVTITAKGQAALAEVRAKRRLAVEPYLAELDPADRHTLTAAVAILERVLTAARQPAADAAPA